MSERTSKKRIIELQASLKISKEALSRIQSGVRDPEGVAEDALYRMLPLETKAPLQGNFRTQSSPPPLESGSATGRRSKTMGSERPSLTDEQRAAAIDSAYRERNAVVAALAKCFPSGIAKTAIEGWDETWHNCVYIDLPTGQASWHFHNDDADLFAGLPPYHGKWDGHTTPEKYARLAALRAERAKPTQSDEERARDTAVTFVDGVLGYSMEFAGSPAAHRQLWDFWEEKFNELFASIRAEGSAERAKLEGKDNGFDQRNNSGGACLGSADNGSDSHDYAGPHSEIDLLREAHAALAPSAYPSHDFLRTRIAKRIDALAQPAESGATEQWPITIDGRTWSKPIAGAKP